jgi:superfamily I DNA and/or RNA helicase
LGVSWVPLWGGPIICTLQGSLSEVNGGRPIAVVHSDSLNGEERVEKASEHSSQGELVPGSFRNMGEAKLVSSIVLRLLKGGLEAKKISIITPYKPEADFLRELLAVPAFHAFGKVELSSVDQFQGAQNRVIVLSCVRSNLAGKVGFFADDRRLNVAMTRAKDAFITVCDVGTFKRCGGLWLSWLLWVESRGLVFSESDVHCDVLPAAGHAV